ncbi:hypothetical protein V2G26_020371 [Clonostachys chloroleuca]
MNRGHPTDITDSPGQGLHLSSTRLSTLETAAFISCSTKQAPAHDFETSNGTSHLQLERVVVQIAREK